MDQGKPQIEVWLEDGLGFYSQGDPARALEAWQRILDVDPEHALAQQYVAYVRQVYHVEASEPPAVAPAVEAPKGEEGSASGGAADVVAGFTSAPEPPAEPAHAARPVLAPVSNAAAQTTAIRAFTDEPDLVREIVRLDEGASRAAEDVPHSSAAPRTENIPVEPPPEARKSPVGHDASSSWMDLVDSAFDVAVAAPGVAPPSQPHARPKHREENPWAPKKAADSNKKLKAQNPAARTATLGTVVEEAPPDAPADARLASDNGRPAAGPADAGTDAGFAHLPSTEPVAGPPPLDPPAAPPAPPPITPPAPAEAPPRAQTPPAPAVLAPVPPSDPTMPLPRAPGASTEETRAFPPAPAAEEASPPAPPASWPTPAPPTLLHQPREEPDPWEVHAPQAAQGPAQAAPGRPWGPKTPPPVDTTFDPWSGDTAPPSGPASAWPIVSPQIEVPSTREVLLAEVKAQAPSPMASGPEPAASSSTVLPRAPTPAPAVAPPAPPPAPPLSPSPEVVPAWRRTAVEEIGSYRMQPGASAPTHAPAAGPASSSISPGAPRPPTSPGAVEERLARAPLRFGNYDDPPPSPPHTPAPAAPPAQSDGPALEIDVEMDGASPWDDGPGAVLDLDVAVQSSPFEDLMRGPPPPAAAPAEAEPAKPVDEGEELMRGARELFELGDFSGSLELVDKVLKADAGHEGALAYLKRNEATLQKMYESKLGDMRKTPRQLMPPDEVIWINMHHKAGFILSQVDGALSYEDILEISGMSRFDTMRILHELVQQGVIG